jgi:hypothetical protein
MTEFETATLFYQIVDLATSTSANFLTIISVMLVVSYLAAHKLDTISTVLILVIFSLFALGNINELYSEYSDLVGLGKQLGELGAKPGSSLSWHGFVMERSGPFLGYIPIYVAMMSILSYLGAIWFFFHCCKTVQDAV